MPPKTPKIRAISLDLDGTLLNSQGKISLKNKEALTQQYKKGVQIIISSGRMTSTILPVCRELNFPMTIISFNGSRLIHFQPKEKNRIELSHSLSEKLSGEVYKYCDEKNLFLNVYLDDILIAFHSQSDFSHADLYANQTGSVYESYTSKVKELSPTNITKLLVITEKTNRDTLYDQIKNDLKEPSQIIKSQPEYIEILKKGITKAQTLKQYLHGSSIQPEECLAMGDAENDLEMLQLAGHGIAVKNCSKGLKASFQNISKWTNDEDSVAHEIESLSNG